MRLFNSPERARRSTLLCLHPLEGRIVPAGSINATLNPNTGALVITGSDDSNVVQLVVGANLTLIPDLETSINGKPEGTQELLNGVVRTIKIDMKGGDDNVSIDGTLPFQVTGAVKIGLGDGNNILNLSTTGMFSTGALTVTAGDGADTVAIAGDANSAINGAARFTFNNGGSSTTIDGVTMASLNVTAGDAVGTPNDVTLTDVTIARSVNVSLGNSNPAIVAVTDSTIGGLTETGQVISALLQNTTVNGNVTLKGGFQADLEVQDDCVLNKQVIVKAPNASIRGTGTGSIFTKNVSLAGSALTQVSFQTTSVTEIFGSILVKGGWYSDTFEGNNFLKVDSNVTLKLGGGDNDVTIGDGNGLALIFGTLSVDAGAGNDTLNIDQLKLSGAAKIKTGAGADTLSIENGSQFLSTFSADVGAGDDTISVAQDTDAATEVKFTGKAKFLTGAGNDTLSLGLSIATGGTNFTKVLFTDPTSSVDGGLGIDFYDEPTSQVNTFLLTNWE